MYKSEAARKITLPFLPPALGSVAWALLLLFVLPWLAPAGCSDGSDQRGTEADRGAPRYTEEREPCSSFNPLRNVYYGDLHAHTALSMDAWIFGTRAHPADAYGFATGRTLSLPPVDGLSGPGRFLAIDRPLDFAAVTEHAEFLGEVSACLDPDSPVYGSTSCRIYREGNFLSTVWMQSPLFFPEPRRSPEICGRDGAECARRAAEVWQEIRNAAEQAYDRSSGCSFTAFIGYEYTATTLATNLHRNILFRNAQVPDLPVSYFEEATAEGLWSELDRLCPADGMGCDAIAVAHNSNESNGNKFFPGRGDESGFEDERRLAALRARVEPLVEIFQNKGDSECLDGLAGVPGEADEVCGFEKLAQPPLDDCGDAVGLGGVMGLGCTSKYDYVRYVLLAGLEEEERLGVNPYKLGVVAATDTHNATPGAVGEDRYEGHLGTIEDTPAKRLSPKSLGGNQGILDNPGGLTAVWAVENSRDAIFEAFLRRETYATSGPRITVRFFGSWSFPDDLCAAPDPVAAADRCGVPMGADLPEPETGETAPRFFVLALRDPGAPGLAGTALQRVQIVKGWLDSQDGPMLRVFDVAGDRENRASVDLETCEPVGEGFDRLCAVWRDPDFDPDERAFYYVRVLENPSCRWSRYECNRLPPAERPAACADPALPQAIQERAWTSPIWYSPMSAVP